ncbi:MAG: methyltransferase domain-containing protein [Nitrososphaeria archaeon]|nr:methyltransferase domain-containing protein [Nitrososphaeria archaeon]
MSIKPNLKEYLQNIDIIEYLKKLDVKDFDDLINGIKYFSENEAAKRDNIILSYFGEEGLSRIIESITGYLLAPPKLEAKSKILDVGCGSGYFTINVAKKVREQLPKASFYAMDVTPAMLSTLVSKTDEIIPFIGVAENISGSINLARKYVKIPRKFDAIFSTLTLHHCREVERVFESIENVLRKNGKAIIIDLCTHPFKEFKEEMGDIHLGFDPSFIEKEAKQFFKKVYIKRMAGIGCKCSGRVADLFIAYLIL